MSEETRTLLIWTGERLGREGKAGGVRLFTYTYDSSKTHPGEPWVMWSELPGHVGRKWRSGSEIGLQELADRILALWLAKVAQSPGLHDRDLAFEAFNEREGYGRDMTEIVHSAFDAGWDARGGAAS